MIVKNFTEALKYEVGGKAKGLYALQHAGLNVPEFVVLPTSTFKNGTPDFSLLPDDKKLLTEILTSWGITAQGVVVRSSIADEDGLHHSFAGMMDSFLNLRNFSDVIEAIKLCAQSAFSERTLAYRKQKNITRSPQPAVIIQKQIIPTSSGVLFTTSPDFPQEIAIHAVTGFSEYLNKGEDTPDEFYLWKKNGALNRKIISPKEHAYSTHFNKGLIKIELEEKARELDALSAAQLDELYTVSNSIEKYFSHPCDVEFVFTNNALFIVQARPITQPIPEVVVYDNSNIQESYCGVTTPLTFSFASRAYATVYKQTMKALALHESTIQKNEIVIQNLLGLVKGRIYYNINNWYRGLQLLPSFKQNKEDMEKMMGLTEPVDFIEDQLKSFMEKCRLLPGILFNLSRLLFAFKKLPGDVERFITNCQHYHKQFYAKDLTSLSIKELLIEKEKLDTNLLHQWTTPIINDFHVMMSNGKVNRNLKKTGVTEVDEFLSRYLSGNKQLASMQPTLQLQLLAEEVKKDHHLRTVILEAQSDIHALVKKQHPAFFEKALLYINTYGDRTIGELKLETETMRVNPIVFYKYLRNFILSPSVDLSGNKKLHQQAVDELTKKLSGKTIFYRNRISRNLANLERAINNREAMRLERTRLFGMYRSIYLAIGVQLERKGILSNRRDIFYLGEEEIIVCEHHEPPSYKNRVNERKRSFDSFRSEDVPSRIIIPYPPSTEILEIEIENSLKGTGCYPGTIEGEIVVITDPDQDIQTAGKIICALRTDPGWAALFPACKGVLIEKGSSLSHSVILLRELGIPTIVNIPRLTKKLQTGQRIHMNSTDGKIQILDYATH
jgi:phosphohistidine swiveling domain-containing protein